jgi:Flp pilus assembly protein TadG
MIARIRSHISNRLAKTVRAFRERTEGFAAVEFAMVVPVMIVMFVGTVEISESYTLARRIVTISGSVADLVTRMPKLNENQLDDIMAIADSLLAGYDSSRLEITVISITGDARGNPIVDWSYDKQGNSPVEAGTPYTQLPNGLIGENESVVVAKVSYKYRPPISQNIIGEITLKEELFHSPRRSVKVERG